MSIGSKIRYYRTLAGMTQTELGEKCGVTYMAVSQWENDYAQPRMGAIETMSKLFGVKKSVLIDDDGVRDELFDELSMLWQTMDARGREAIIALARSLSVPEDTDVSEKGIA